MFPARSKNTLHVRTLFYRFKYSFGATSIHNVFYTYEMCFLNACEVMCAQSLVFFSFCAFGRAPNATWISHTFLAKCKLFCEIFQTLRHSHAFVLLQRFGAALLCLYFLSSNLIYEQTYKHLFRCRVVYF